MFRTPCLAATLLIAGYCLLPLGRSLVAAEAELRAPAAMRALPTARRVPLAEGPKKFVDAERGDDASDGSEAKPWRTLGHALRQLVPGDTLYLRGGVYYEKASLSKSGTAVQPITVAAYPGEVAVLDGGLREFVDDPANAWQPYRADAVDEYVSTKTYPWADARRVPTQFLPAAWEPMHGLEDERPLALGNFADSMVPLHGYRMAGDLRSSNEFWLGGKTEGRDVGNYCGPGLWFNRETGRIHIRLAPTQLAGLGERAYRGETDPRKLKLHIALGFGDEVFRAVGVKHVVVRDLIIRGATGSPMIHVYGCHDLTFDHDTIYGGFPGLLLNASQKVRVTNSAFRGLAAPWTSRAHMKYRGTPSYQVVFHNNQPLNEDIEIANCEFTDDHDFAFFRYAKNLRFHHNMVDNFNDDGIEIGPKLRDHSLFLYQNRIGRCLIPLSQHENVKDDSPIDHDPMTGTFLYRNVVDLRGGTYKSPPTAADPTGSFLAEQGHVAGDHGGPIWPVMRVYHNTLLRDTQVFRDQYLFGLATAGLRHNERDVFNNIFVQSDKLPGVGFVAVKQAPVLREGGNLLWGLKAAATASSEPFAKFLASPLFTASQQHYAAGWTTHDRVADPRFVRLSADRNEPTDLRLQADSPAVNTGLPLPADWPDPLRTADAGEPDIGVIPLGTAPWGIGVDGRLSLFATGN
jgi:hypothetical protein